MDSPPSQTALLPKTNLTGSFALIPIALGAFGWKPKSICSNLALSNACGLGFWDVDHVVGMLGDCWSAGGEEEVGCLEGTGGEGWGIRVV